MASITAGTPTSTLPCVGFRPNGGTVGTSSAILGKISFLFLQTCTSVFVLSFMGDDDRLQGCLRESEKVDEGEGRWEDGSMKMGRRWM